jgi:Glucose / Sorbosone dehydrogenase/Secretion system C-terminal sorting domain
VRKIIPIGIVFVFFVSINVAQNKLQPAFPNLTFSFTTEMICSNDSTNRLFILTQRGIIYVFQNDSSVASAKIFLNLSDSVSKTGEETGLLGMAFHPDFESNKYFYVDYTTNQSPLRSKISRFQVSQTNPDSAIRNSEFVLLTQLQPYSHHNGGHLVFGPDGYLYISFGDGGSEGDPDNNAQNRTLLLGKILRINVDSSSGGNNYSVPVTNPFYGNTQGWRQEIFTYGMRNTWKFSFDLPTGRIWAADVGQDSWEEIDLLQSGKNYGWRIMEGFACYNPPDDCDTTGLTLPIWSYGRTEGHSITGGYVYRGSAIPQLIGKYIYADYVLGRIWSLTYDGINPTLSTLLYDSPDYISTFGIDRNDEIYICTYGTYGKIYKLHLEPIGIGTSSRFPGEYILNQNYPNPFNPSTTITFSISKESQVSIKIYNIQGKYLETILNEKKSPGTYSVIWNASSYPSAVYIYSLNSGSTNLYKKMVLVK